MAPSSTPNNDHAGLRRLTIYSFPPAFIILLIHGVASGQAFPALGILPLAASAVLGLFITRRDAVAAIGSPVQALSEANILFADVALAAFHIIFLIISWITIRNPWDEGMIVLGTYGTVFMMLDFGLHVYIALPQLVHMLIRRNCDCPHCRSVAKAGYSWNTTSEYTPLSEGDEPEDLTRDLEEGTRIGHSS